MKYIGMINIEIPASNEDPGSRPRFRKNAEPNNGNTLAIDDLHPKNIKKQNMIHNKVETHLKRSLLANTDPVYFEYEIDRYIKYSEKSRKSQGGIALQR